MTANRRRRLCRLSVSLSVDMIREEILSEVQTLPTDTVSLRKFGVTMGVVFGVFSIVTWYRMSATFPLMFFLFLGFYFTGITYPQGLKKIYSWWMTLAVTLGYFMTRVILSILFYGVFLPIGFLARLFRTDMLDEGYDSGARSYWERRQAPNDVKRHLERQF